MSKVKRFLAFILCVAMCAGFAIPAMADDEQTISYTTEVEVGKNETFEITYEITGGEGTFDCEGFQINYPDKLPDGIEFDISSSGRFQGKVVYIDPDDGEKSNNLGSKGDNNNVANTISGTDTVAAKSLTVKFKVTDEANVGTIDFTTLLVMFSRGKTENAPAAELKAENLVTKVKVVDDASTINPVIVASSNTSYTYKVGMDPAYLATTATITNALKTNPKTLTAGTDYAIQYDKVYTLSPDTVKVGDALSTITKATPIDVSELHAGDTKYYFYVAPGEGMSGYTYAGPFTIATNTTDETHFTLKSATAQVAKGGSVDLSTLVDKHHGTLEYAFKDQSHTGWTLSGSSLSADSSLAVGASIKMKITDSGELVKGSVDFAPLSKEVTVTVIQGVPMYAATVEVPEKTYDAKSYDLAGLTMPAAFFTDADLSSNSKISDVPSNLVWTYTYDGKEYSADALDELASQLVNVKKDEKNEVTSYKVTISTGFTAEDEAKTVYYYTGELDIKINPLEVTAVAFTDEAPTGEDAYVYNGEAYTPLAKLTNVTAGTLTAEDLTEGPDYSFAYTNNVNAGEEATITIVFSNNFTVAESVASNALKHTFVIKAANPLSKEPVASKLIYTGKPQKLYTDAEINPLAAKDFNVTVTYSITEEKTAAQKYTVTYTVTKTAKNEGAVEGNWAWPTTAKTISGTEILKADLSGAVIDVKSVIDLASAASETANIKVTLDGFDEETFVSGEDYNLVITAGESSSAPVTEITEPGLYYVTVSPVANGNFTGESKTSFYVQGEETLTWTYAKTGNDTITATSGDAKMTLQVLPPLANNPTYDGVTNYTARTVGNLPGSYTLKYTYGENGENKLPVTEVKNAGTYTATIEAADEEGNTVSASTTYTVAKADLDETVKLSFSTVALKEGNVRSSLPSVTVTFNGVEVTQGADYELTWKQGSNEVYTIAADAWLKEVKAAETLVYTATIKGIGNFNEGSLTGTVTASVAASYGITEFTDANGNKVTASNGVNDAKVAQAGQQITLTVTPKDKETVLKNGTLQTDVAGLTPKFLSEETKDNIIVSTYTFLMPASDVTVSAEFGTLKFTVTAAEATAEAAETVVETVTTANEGIKIDDDVKDAIDAAIQTAINNASGNDSTKLRITATDGEDETLVKGEDAPDVHVTDDALEALGLDPTTASKNDVKVSTKPEFKVKYSGYTVSSASGTSDFKLSAVKLSVDAMMTSTLSLTGNATMKVPLGSKQVSLKGTPVTLQLPMPTGFEIPGDNFWVKHESGQIMRFGKSGNWANGILKIPGYNMGFSSLDILTEDPEVASYTDTDGDTTSFASFQLAVNAAMNDIQDYTPGGATNKIGTVTILASAESYSATVNPTTDKVGFYVVLDDAAGETPWNVASSNERYAVLRISDDGGDLAYISGLTDLTIVVKNGAGDDAFEANATVTATYTKADGKEAVIQGTYNGSNGKYALAAVPDPAVIAATYGDYGQAKNYSDKIKNNGTLYVSATVKITYVDTKGNILKRDGEDAVYEEHLGDKFTILAPTVFGDAYAKYTWTPSISGFKVDMENPVDVPDEDLTLKLTAPTNPPDNPNPYSGGGGGGGGTSNNVTVTRATNGTVTVSNYNPTEGQKVTITATPNTGYKVGSVTVTDAKGNTIAVTDNGNGTYTFTMPAKDLMPVKVTATFVEAGSTPSSSTGFTDVADSDWFADAVKWAVAQNITQGKGNSLFAPYDTCTRAEAVTFLYRAAGSPAVTAAASFSDVSESDWFANAVAWAVAQGITQGKGDGLFAPYDTCSRAEIVTFLARFAKAGETEPSTQFTDVAATDYYAGAVAWAVANGITQGKNSTTTFVPNDGCNRAEIVTFLYRYFVK